ncbi:MAG: outer membrane protein OmpW, partial [Gammaproteobacteria bacterium]|nr:outer membrane protein OmpW [Gammaproteobacteria bacterium]
MKISIKKKMITTALFSTLVAASFSTLAAEGDWLVRFGAVNVAPNDSSNPDLVAVESNAQAFVNFSYMLKSNIAIEVLAATPFTHDIVGSGVLAASGKLGETQQLPPTVSVQYHFKPTANIRPYVGAGIN